MGKMGSREEKKVQEEKEVPFLFILTVPIRLLVLLIRRGKEKEKEQTQGQKATWSFLSLEIRGEFPRTPQEQGSEFP